MDGFEFCKRDIDSEIGSGFSGNSEYMKIKDEENKRILMEEQFNLVQTQRLKYLPNKNTVGNKSKMPNYQKGFLSLILLLQLLH